MCRVVPVEGSEGSTCVTGVTGQWHVCLCVCVCVCVCACRDKVPTTCICVQLVLQGMIRS